MYKKYSQHSTIENFILRKTIGELLENWWISCRSEQFWQFGVYESVTRVRNTLLSSVSVLMFLNLLRTWEEERMYKMKIYEKIKKSLVETREQYLLLLERVNVSTVFFSEVKANSIIWPTFFLHSYVMDGCCIRYKIPYIP